MADMQLGAIEARFAERIWAMAPVSTTQLVHLAADEFGWKRTTTHTVIRRLCEKGLFENNGGTVCVRITREQYTGMQSRNFVHETFSGSLPAFLAAFTSQKRLTQDELDEVQRMIDAYRREVSHE